jgi:translation initiation factor eIF-2B subunit epsilon
VNSLLVVHYLQVFIFCVWHAEKIQEYVNNSKWPSILTVRCIQSTSCLSAGDALRELDVMNVIRSDPFVLISGDVISNINLKEAIAFHKRKRKEDINNVMTLVLKEVQKTAGAKPLLDDLVVAMDRATSQIVLFENSHKKGSVKVSLELMAEHPKGLTFSTDLLDCHVDICSPELMVQFSDNFDYQVKCGANMLLLLLTVAKKRSFLAAPA